MSAIAEVEAEKTHTVSEWVEWTGGECPVKRRTLVQIQCEFEVTPDESQMACRAGTWDEALWKHEGLDRLLFIVAYRIVEGQ